MTAHPSWCDRGMCEVNLGGTHRSTAIRIGMARPAPPRLVLVLTAAPGRAPAVRLVTISGGVVAETTLTVGEAVRAADAILELAARTAPPPEQAPLEQADGEPASGPLGKRGREVRT